MTNTQITLIQIDNYGPWTVTPEPRREVDLQTLQSRLYTDLSQLFGNHDGYVFFSRFDNMIAVTNGIKMETNLMIQESVANRYPVTVSLSIATGETPAAALETASTQLQDAGSAQDEAIDARSCEARQFRRNTALTGTYKSPTSTSTTQRESIPTNSTRSIHSSTSSRATSNSCDISVRPTTRLSFFVGGDNIISRLPDSR